MSNLRDDHGTVLPPKLLNGDELAEILNISRSFAYILMRRGDIPTVKLGKCVRVRPQDLDAYINSQVQGTGVNVSVLPVVLPKNIEMHHN